MEIRERILQYLEYKNISKYKFYQQIEVSNGFLDKSGAIGSDKCEKICYHYTDLNIKWLILGEGPMINDPYDIAEEPKPIYNKSCKNCIEKNKIIEILQDNLKTKDKLISSMEDRIESLKKLCDFPEECAKKGDKAG